MADTKAAKYRIIDRAEAYAQGKITEASEKLSALLKAVAADQAYWLWVNEALGDDFFWASEVMAAGLNRPEVKAVAKYLNETKLSSVRFEDSKAYLAIIADALASSIMVMKRALLSAIKKLEENTACVYKFTNDGPIATGYPHGVPVVCYFTKEGTVFVVYVPQLGANQPFASAAAIPLPEEHIVKQVARGIERSRQAFDAARRLQAIVVGAEDRLATLQKFGRTVIG